VVILTLRHIPEFQLFTTQTMRTMLEYLMVKETSLW
jgi:hypothetical protein